MDRWDLYFATLAGWTFHPGYSREGTERPTMQDCKDIADIMEQIANERENSKVR